MRFHVRGLFGLTLIKAKSVFGLSCHLIIEPLIVVEDDFDRVGVLDDVIISSHVRRR